jgi:alpha-L-rhamnosidase
MHEVTSKKTLSSDRKRYVGSERLLLVMLALGLMAALVQGKDREPAALDELRRSFVSPPADSRIMMRWWWFGPSVTDAELARELEVMTRAGIGGVEIQPVYPVEFDDPASGLRIEPFLSDAFLAHVGFAARKARELGMRLDLTLGSGWPYGGPAVGVSDAAGKLRVERVPIPPSAGRVAVPHIGVGERWIAGFIVGPGDTTAAEDASPITEIHDGVVEVTPAGASRELLAFISSRTGMMVKRAAVGAEGFVLDHYDRGALDRYLDSVGRPLLQAFDGGPSPDAVFCDSLEVFGSDWTTDFVGEFRRRRGYDLLPHLPALVDGASGPESAEVRHDWGQTLTELLNDRFLQPLRSWAAARGTLLRAQVYGMPPATVSSNLLVDLPEGEGSQWRELRASRWAASATHVAGRPVVSSETWTWLHSPSFMASPLDMKAEADRHFLQGINQLVGHGWPYVGRETEYPGWRFYAAAAFNDRNPWFDVMPDVTRSLQRLSFVLRQGTPQIDVALLLPVDDAWSEFAPGRVHLIDVLKSRVGATVIPTILDAGYNLDFVDPTMLSLDSMAEGARLRVGAQRYSTVVLPGIERMTLETLATLESFARGGGRLIAVTRTPDAVPGLVASNGSRTELRVRVARLFEGPDAIAQLVQPDGLGAALLKRLDPDAAVEPLTSAVGHVHRHIGDTDVYFVANTSNQQHRVTMTLRVAARHAEWWDPVTATMTGLDVVPLDRDRTQVALDLPPYGSGLIVLAQNAAAPRSHPRAAALTIDLSHDWTLTLRSTVHLGQLHSWTDVPEGADYSGLGVYTREVDVPARMLGGGRRLTLDLGTARPTAERPLTNGMRAWLEAPVREAAIVWVNGRKAGSVWMPPYRVSLDGLLHPGRNTIEIRVGNLAINAMAARPLPDYSLLNLRYGARFTPQDMDQVKPVPAGLLGAITLISY